jgi:hypothetical protein
MQDDSKEFQWLIVDINIWDLLMNSLNFFKANGAYFGT